jgi:tetratricopeptide (TPR) repeat protein
LQSDDPKGAVAVLEPIVAQDPGRAEAWLLLAEARAAQGDLAGAIEACTSSLRADGTYANALKLRARLRMLSDDYERAFADYELLARGRPNDAGAYLGSAGALIALNRLPEAKARVDRAAELKGDHPKE